MKQQGTSNVEAGNNFDDPNNTSAGVSRNTEWDILWQNPTPNGGGGDIDYNYYRNTGNFPPGYRPNSSGSVLGYGNYTMNGVTHPCVMAPCSQGDPDLDLLNTTNQNPSCYGLWKKTPTSSSYSQKQKHDNFKVYPNPFAENINLRFGQNQDRTVKVMNLQGQRILKQRTQGKNHTLNTADWKPGTYFLKIITSQGEVRTQKVVKLK